MAGLGSFVDGFASGVETRHTWDDRKRRRSIEDEDRKWSKEKQGWEREDRKYTTEERARLRKEQDRQLAEAAAERDAYATAAETAKRATEEQKATTGRSINLDMNPGGIQPPSQPLTFGLPAVEMDPATGAPVPIRPDYNPGGIQPPSQPLSTGYPPMQVDPTTGAPIAATPQGPNPRLGGIPTPPDRSAEGTQRATEILAAEQAAAMDKQAAGTRHATEILAAEQAAARGETAPDLNAPMDARDRQAEASRRATEILAAEQAAANATRGGGASGSWGPSPANASTAPPTAPIAPAEAIDRAIEQQPPKKVAATAVQRSIEAAPNADPTLVPGAADPSTAPSTQVATAAIETELDKAAKSPAGRRVSSFAELIKSDPKTAEAHQTRATKTFLDNYLEKSVPGLIEHMVKTGQIEKAKAFDAWVKEEKQKTTMAKWARGVFAASVGDEDGMLDAFAEYYNEIPDGVTVDRKNSGFETVPGSTERVFKLALTNDRTGKSTVQTIKDNGDLLQIGIHSLSPERMFEVLQDQQKAADAIKAKGLERDQAIILAAMKTAGIGDANSGKRVAALMKTMADNTPGFADLPQDQRVAMVLDQMQAEDRAVEAASEGRYADDIPVFE